MPNNWFSDTNNPAANPPSDVPAKKYIPSPAKIRKMAMDSKEGGRFTCPTCHVAFSVTYGTFGSTKAFEEPTFYCKDCAKANPTFRKAR